MSEDQLQSTECTIVIPGEPIIQLTENGVEGFEILCRICANRSDHLIAIYSEEGISNGLAEKMNLYLPVKVNKTDLLPLQCCYQCASTVLTWHELVIASVEADRRLRNIQDEVEKQLAEQQNVEAESSQEEIEKTADSEDERSAVTSAVSLNPFRQEPQQHDTEQAAHTESEQTKVPQSAAAGATDTATVDTGPVVQRKRGRPAKNRQLVKDGELVKVENGNADLTTDGDWIKTELVLEPEDVNPFIADCQLTEEPGLKLSPVGSGSDNCSDFDELDPEYDPENDTEFVPKPKTQHGCPNCTKSFRKITDLRKHLKHCEPEMKEEVLDQEDVGSGEEYTPEDEKKSVDRKFKREYRCDYCPTLMMRKGDLKKHIQSQHPDKFENFHEKRQKRRSKIDQEAVNRAKVVVDSRTYYHCNECGKNLHSPYTYIWHNRIHTGERPFVCDLCGKQFRVSQGLVRHLRETHAGIKNFSCDLCGRMFATRRNVEEHRRIHTNERPYICDLCGKAFKQKASLFVHNRSHTDSFPYKCSYCNQGFRTRPPLLVHVTRHTGEKPYACDICGRCFRIKYELKRHRLIHSDDKPFSCTECGLSFRQKRYLRNHNKINHKRQTP